MVDHNYTVDPLPTQNTNLTQRTGDFKSIVEALDYAALGSTGLTFYDQLGNPSDVMSYEQLRSEALCISGRLFELGFLPGQHIAIIGETSAEFLKVFYGCQYAGLIPCTLPYSIMLGGLNAFLEKTRRLVEASNACLLCIPDALVDHTNQWRKAGVRIASFSELSAPPHRSVQLSDPVHPYAYIQFSSGSTAEPKGILISQAALVANVQAILRDLIEIKPDDRAFSWLPFYHDMGLVGFSLAPLFSQTSVDYLAPTSFARRPGLWLELMHKNRSTISFAPIFGYRLAAQRVIQNTNRYDLSRWRIAGIGGDMILKEELDTFANATRQYQFNKDAFTPSYGMAESALLVSFQRGVKTSMIDRDYLETTGQAIPSLEGENKEFVICGEPLPRHDISITDNKGMPLPDRHMGQIVIKGPSLLSGYCISNGIQLIDVKDGFLTGDMGYLEDGRLVITGRSKDLIIVNGRNIWPQDIEKSLNDIQDFKRARIAAFSVTDGANERPIVLIENAPNDPAFRAKLDAATAVIKVNFGINAKVVFVPPKTLEFTSSGKLSRAAARRFYEQHYSARRA